MEVDIPTPNKALGEFLLSGRLRAILLDRAHFAQAVFEERVARVTNELATTAVGFVEIGGKRHDRWIGVLLIGAGLEYGAAEEFGHREGKRVEKVAGRLSAKRAAQINAARRFVPGAHDLNAVLEALDAS